jgi:serine carboxypeptidase-like clade 1
MDGWGYEHGPVHFRNFYMKDQSKPLLTLNEHTWATVANIIFMEAPPGVGFSWSDSGNYTISDSQNALNNHAALVTFFTQKFPEYAQNPFYISGESYAGIYVPTLAWEVMRQGGMLNQSFRGVLVGNGVTSDKFDNFLHGALPFGGGHGIISQLQWSQMTAACNSTEGLSSPACNEAQSQFWTTVGGLDIYGIYLDCFNRPNYHWKYLPILQSKLRYLLDVHGEPSADMFIEKFKARNGIPPGPPNDEAPCVDDYTMEQYFNRSDVKAALHVQSSLTWSLCYQINYISDITSVLYVYTELIQQGKRVLVYNGNTDITAWVGPPPRRTILGRTRKV